MNVRYFEGFLPLKVRGIARVWCRIAIKKLLMLMVLSLITAGAFVFAALTLAFALAGLAIAFLFRYRWILPPKSATPTSVAGQQ